MIILSDEGLLPLLFVLIIVISVSTCILADDEGKSHYALSIIIANMTSTSVHYDSIHYSPK